MVQSQTYPLLKKFKPAGSVRRAEWTQRPPWIKQHRLTGRFAQGMKYERQVREHLALLVLGQAALDYREGPWIVFWNDYGRRFCQPDALLLDQSNRVCIVYEVKYQHCVDAWFQLRELYCPVVQRLLPGWTVGLMEICHWHDPQVVFPQAYSLTRSPLRIPKANEVAVCIFNPKRGGFSRVLEDGRGDSESSSQGSRGQRCDAGAH